MGYREDFVEYLVFGDIYAHISGLDNQPYAILDAIFQGKVVLCNNIGGIQEMIDTNNNIFVNLNTLTIRNMLQSIIYEIRNNPNKFKNRGEHNKIYAIEKYSTPKVISNYVRLYK